MALKVVELLDARPDLKRTVVPRLGELHVLMATDLCKYSIQMPYLLFTANHLM